MAETNASGAAVQINTYDEYGMPGSGNTSRFGYTGQMWIAEIGLYHYRNRVYNPAIGRFMQTDPIGQAGGINLYAYVSNDPVNHTDPWGLMERIAVNGTRSCIFCGKEPPIYLSDLLSLFSGGLLQNIGQIGQDVIGQDRQEGESACSDIIPDNTNGNPSRRGAARVGSFYGGPTQIERRYERHVAAATAMLERSGHGAAISMWSRMNVIAGSWDMGPQAQYNSQTQTIIINPNLYVNITFAMLHELGHALTMTAWRGTINQYYGGDVDLYNADRETSGTPAHLFEQRMNDFANCIMSQ